MSSNERRAASYNISGGARPRVVSNRGVGGESNHRISRQGEETSTKPPRMAEKMEHLRGSTSSARGLHKEPGSAIDRRTERTTITTRDKLHVKTRNPVKESPNAGNRGEFERSRSKKTASPPRRKEKDVVDGTH